MKAMRLWCEMTHDEIYKKYKNLVFSLVRDLKDDAEDVMQDTFLTFFQFYPDLTEKLEIKNLLCKIGKNKKYNFLKKRREYETNLDNE